MMKIADEHYTTRSILWDKSLWLRVWADNQTRFSIALIGHYKHHYSSIILRHFSSFQATQVQGLHTWIFIARSPHGCIYLALMRRLSARFRRVWRGTHSWIWNSDIWRRKLPCYERLSLFNHCGDKFFAFAFLLRPWPLARAFRRANYHIRNCRC